MKGPIVIGVDPSITSTGMALSDGSLMTVGGKADRGDERLLEIACAMGTACYQADLVVIEFLPAHMKGAGITGMVQGVIRLVCLRASVPYVLVPPSTLKKYATGSGAADKGDMKVALFERTGVKVKSNDEVDAAWLRFAGLQKLGAPEVSLPAVQVRALDAVAWPDVLRGVA
jgi:Holliday junction resolvasome RuvABC endonuclease subunit